MGRHLESIDGQAEQQHQAPAPASGRQQRYRWEQKHRRERKLHPRVGQPLEQPGVIGAESEQAGQQERDHHATQQRFRQLPDQAWGVCLGPMSGVRLQSQASHGCVIADSMPGWGGGGLGAEGWRSAGGAGMGPPRLLAVIFCPPQPCEPGLPR